MSRDDVDALRKRLADNGVSVRIQTYPYNEHRGESAYIVAMRPTRP